jgi:hypothetical protein
MLRAVQAIVFGSTAVLRAPTLILMTYGALVITTIPAVGGVALLLDRAFQQRVLEERPPGGVDAAWLSRAAKVTEPVAGDSFAPVMFGFGVLLSNLDDLARGDLRSWGVVSSVAMWLVIWTFLLGGVLERFVLGRPFPASEFLNAAANRFAPFAAIAVVTAAVLLVVTLVVQVVPLSVRLPVFAVLGAGVTVTAVVASYTRAHIVVTNVALRQAVGDALGLFRRHPVSVLTHVGIAGSALGLLVVGMAAADFWYGAGGQPWRPVVVAQAYVVARIVGRLVWEASAIALVRNALRP